MQHRVANAEKCISTLEEDLRKEKSVAHELPKKVTFLCDRLDDIESRSRGNNIMMIGIKEGMEAGDLTGLLVRIFRYVLGAGESDPVPAVDQAHRVLRPRPNPEDPPHNIIVGFHGVSSPCHQTGSRHIGGTGGIGEGKQSAHTYADPEC